MKLRHAYLGFCVLGVALPLWQFVPWLAAHGLDPSLFVHDLFANRVAGFFGMDVLVSAVVLFVGVSLGLPLFLYLRQAHLDRAAA